ncbi:MAG: hypothetical protein GX927_02330 [Lentisphaerae bacterium]|nr:hypothetical protein [Lentisphaerota bacterium]
METKPFLAYRSFYTPLNTIEKFAGCGYETICVFPAHTVNSRGTPYSQYRPVWLWFDKLDFSPLDDMITDISRAMPEAKFLCMIDLNSPVWLEHMNCYSCSDSFNNLGKAIHNPEWLQPTKQFLEKFLRYTEEKYGDRILAYIPACGATDEWYDYSNGTEGTHRREAWRKWNLERGNDDPIDIPPQSVREHTPHEGFLRNFETDREAINYWKLCNEAIADALLDFAAITRKLIRKETQVGCFYGYILEKCYRTLVSCGHLAYERVLDSPDIDFLISPGTYTDREIGGGSGFLIPNGTAAIRGKRVLHECDQRTHTYNSYLTPYINLRVNSAWPDEKSTVAGLKREASLGLLKRANLWWFDMWGDYYQGEVVMNTLKQVRKLWDERSGIPARDVCEVALIVDPDSTYLVNENHPFAPEMNRGLRNKLNRLGAPFEVYSFNDIPMIPNFERYKFVIFSSAFRISPEKHAILQQHVLRAGRFILWLYAPGIAMEGTFHTDNCKKLTGIPYKASGLQVKNMGNWHSCYIYDYREVTPAVLKKLAQEAGVLLYTEKELPVYAEGNLLAVHVKEGGQIPLSVPPEFHSAEELFTGKICTVENGRFEYDFLSPDTALFTLKK